MAASLKAEWVSGETKDQHERSLGFRVVNKDFNWNRNKPSTPHRYP